MKMHRSGTIEQVDGETLHDISSQHSSVWPQFAAHMVAFIKSRFPRLLIHRPGRGLKSVCEGYMPLQLQ